MTNGAGVWSGRRWRKRLRRTWRRFVFHSIVLAARCAGPADSRRVKVVSWLAGTAALIARPDLLRRDLDNLTVALGAGVGGRTRTRILYASLVSSARSAVRAMTCVVRHDAYRGMLERVSVTGREHLDAALVKGGVVAVSAHLGDFALSVLWLAQAGYPITMTIREAKHVPPGMFREAFARLGVEAVVVDSDRQATQTLLRALKAGRMVVIYLDQDAKAGGLELPFLGKRTPIPTGPAVLAQRTGASVVPMVVIDQPDGGGSIEILPGWTIAASPSRGEAVASHTRRLAEIIEDCIRQRPAQWTWRYRRWRNRPRIEPNRAPAPV